MKKNPNICTTIIDTGHQFEVVVTKGGLTTQDFLQTADVAVKEKANWKV